MVKITDAEEESSRFTFPDWLKDRVCAKRGVNRDGCAFSAQSDSKNTAIHQKTLEQENPTIFLGILRDAGWTVYLLDAGKMQRDFSSCRAASVSAIWPCR